MKKLVSGVLLSVVSVSAFANTTNAKTLADEKATFELCEKFSDTLNKSISSDSKLAFNVLRPYAFIPQIEIDNIEYQTNQLIKNNREKVSEYIETLHVDTNKFAKDHFIQHRFLLKRTLNGWYTSCIFYKPKDKWQLHTFTFYDNPIYFKH